MVRNKAGKVQNISEININFWGERTGELERKKKKGRERKGN